MATLNPFRFPVAAGLRFGALLLLLAAAAFQGCAPSSRPILLEGPPEAAEPDRRWEKYGAYYEVDELFVESSFLQSPLVTGPTSRYIVNKRIRILSAAGAEHGTVRIPQYTGNPSVFRVSHWDSLGKPIKVALEPLRTEYLKTGKVVVPNVAAGSVISIRLEFSSLAALNVLEHWFSGPIPVVRGRLTFSHLDYWEYEGKSYGQVREGSTDNEGSPGKINYQAWVVRDVLPRTNVNFQDDIDVTEPRVAVAIRAIRDQEIWDGWEKIADSYEQIALKPSFFNSTRRLRKLVDSLAQGKSGKADKAKAAFAWVQKNISHQAGPIRAINPDRVISAGTGTLWEMAVVMREMFRHLELGTGLLVTRPRSLGGFDPAFVSPIQLAIPLVTVRLDKREHVAFPWARGAALGEYPADYMGIHALSLESGHSASLPEPVLAKATTRNAFRLGGGEGEPVSATLEMGGYVAFSVRQALQDDGKRDVREAFQKLLTRMGTSNALARCEVAGLDQPGTPVKADLTFTNPDQSTSRKGETQTRLSHLFTAYFQSYDTSRVAGYRSHLEVEHTEEVKVEKSPERSLVANIPCRNQDNKLFAATCSVSETPVEYLFTRTVLIRRAGLTAEEMRGLAGEIADLNRIEEGTLVWKSAAVAVPAPPTAGSAKAGKPRKGPDR